MPAPLKPVIEPLALKADELGQLKKEQNLLLAPFALKKPRMEALEKELRAAAEASAAPDAEFRIQGARFEVILSPRSQWRTVNVPKLLKLIGVKIFAKIASVTVGAVEAECKPEVVAAVVTKDFTGPRTLKTVEKGA